MSRNRFFGVAIAATLMLGVGADFLLGADEPAKPPAQAHGQSAAQGGALLSLLRLQAVAKDLNLTDEQRAALKKIADDASKEMAQRRASQKGKASVEEAVARLQAALEFVKKVNAVLNEKQRARYQEIWLQVRGPSALRDKEIAAALKLTSDQQKKLNDLAEERRAAIHAVIKAAGAPAKPGQDGPSRAKIAKIAKDAADKMQAVLTPEQSEQFEKMQGKKLDLGTAAFGALGGAGHRPTGSESKPATKPDSK